MSIVKFGISTLAILAILSGCEEGALSKFTKTSPNGDTASGASTKTVERDVEAPEVFSLTESGLWDGRPSLGGVWVAHPSAKDPERVIIRNEANGKFVIGALFRRERELPGPRIQVSSDAATALEMLAGQPASLNVTALRKEIVGVAEPTNPEALKPSDGIATTSLDNTLASASAAIETSTPKTPAVAKPTKPTNLKKPYVQIGIFSVEQNALNTAQSLRGIGVIPTIKPGNSKNKPFWRVIVGPTNRTSDRAALLKKVKKLGFNDAYFVSG